MSVGHSLVYIGWFESTAFNSTLSIMLKNLTIHLETRTRQSIGDISGTLFSGYLRARIYKPSRITLPRKERPQEALRLGRNRHKEPRNGYISMYHSHKSEPGFYYMSRIRARWWSDIRAIRGERRHNSNSLVSIQNPDRFAMGDRTGGC